MATPQRPSGTLFRIRAGLALAAAGALLAACGSSSKGTASTNGTISTAPSTSSSAASKSGGGGGGTVNLGGGSFCDKAKSAVAAQAKSAEAITSDTPADLKKLEEQANSELQQLASQAPSEIKGAVTTISGAVTNLFNALDAANFDFTKVSSQLTQLESQFNSPQFMQAVQQIDTYLATKCGINPSALPS